MTTNNTTLEKLYTPKEAMQFFPWLKTEFTIRRWIHSGALKVHTIKKSINGDARGNKYFLSMADIEAFRKEFIVNQ